MPLLGKIYAQLLIGFEPRGSMKILEKGVRKNKVKSTQKNNILALSKKK
jgi:hypothetical protein